MKFSALILATIAVAKVFAGGGQCGEGVGSCGSGECCSKYGWCGTSDKYCGTGCQEAFGECTSTRVTSSHPISTDGRCGPSYGNTSCPDNKCCSKYGWCGTSSSYCGSNCLSEFGVCSNSSSTTSTKKSSTTTKTKTTTSAATQTSGSSTTHPTSTDGRCGPSFGNTACPLGDCCSKYGWCGSSANHCGTGCQSEFGMCNSGAITTTTKTSTTKTKTATTTAGASHPTSTNGRCGPDNGNTSCPNNECCSKYGWCGTNSDYCDSGCQSEFGSCGNSSSGSGSSSGGSSTPSSGIAVYTKCKNSKHWALTYDDGPYSFDESLLDYLKSVGVKATFFVNGDNVMEIKSDRGRSIIKRMIADGHEIGSHTWRHSDLATLSESGIKEEITKLEDALVEIIGKKPAFIRPPYGSGAYDSTVQKNLQKLGYTGIIMWNVDTLDWSTKGDSDYALSVFKDYVGKGIISLNHCFYQEISESKIVNLAKKEINYMLSQGYTPVTMSECIGLDPYQ